MTIVPGTRLGAYEVVGLLGEGGMGRVYRARDPRLGRQVAIKVIAAGQDLSPDWLRRFEQEAQAAAALQHPNIIAVHDVGSYEGAPYIVSELLEGTTLRDRLAAGPLPTRKAIEMAVQIAHGLAAAHGRRITHRDLKPENIFLTRDGHVKILDFGLAKLAAADAGGESQLATVEGVAVTGPGLVMGTAGYMSPEQVRGETVDSRTDIFSLGATLYEMITGRRAFGGRTAADAMSAVLREDPAPMTQGGQPVPAPLERLVGYCLEKDPAHRMQSAHDIAMALEAISAGSGSASDAAAAAAMPSRRRPRWFAAAVAAAFAVVAGLALFLGRVSVRPMPVPTLMRVTFQTGHARNARFGADSSSLIYSAVWGDAPEQVYTARVDSPESSAFGPRNLMLAAVSPSGELAVIRDPMTHPANSLGRIGTLARMPAAGGAPRDVLEDVEVADWSPDGRDLAIVRTIGGRARIEFPIGAVVFETAGWIDSLRVSPDGAAIAFAEHPLTADDRGWVSVIDVKNKTARRLTPERASVRGTAWRGREVVFGSGSDIEAVEPDGSTRMVASATSSAYVCDIATDGTVLVNLVDIRVGTHVLTSAGEERDVTWLDATLPIAFWPDGRRFLFWEGFRYGAYARDLDGSPAVRLGDGTPMSLSSDGKSVLAVQHMEPMRLVVYPTGAGQSRTLPTGGVTRISWGHWTPDGRHVVFSGEEPGQGERVFVAPAEGGKPTAVSRAGTALVRFAGDMVSPDGRFVLGTAGGQAYVLVPLEGGEPQPVGGFRHGDRPIGWEPDGRSFLVHEYKATWPLHLVRVDLATGSRQPWRTVTSSQREPFLFSQVVVSRDRQSVAFLVNTTRSALFTVQVE